MDACRCPTEKKRRRMNDETRARPAPAEPHSAREQSSGPAVPEPAMLFCPVCSRRLAARSCKLFCPGCGYYMSCADYY